MLATGRVAPISPPPASIQPVPFNLFAFLGLPQDARLRYSIEAFFYNMECRGQAVLNRRCTGRDEATKLHTNFLTEFGLTRDAVPLLKLDPKNWDTPFALDS